MHLMPDPVAAAIAPQPPPASDVLDLVMQGGQVFTVEPPAPFALIVAEAFDRGMPASDWTAWTGPAANPALRAALLLAPPLRIDRRPSSAETRGLRLILLSYLNTCGGRRGLLALLGIDRGSSRTVVVRESQQEVPTE